MPSRAPRPRPRPKPKAVDYRRAAALLRHASDPTRLHVLLILAKGEQTVGAICGMVGLRSMSPLSRQLAFLRHGGLVARRHQGKNRVYDLTDLGRRLAGAARALLE